MTESAAVDDYIAGESAKKKARLFYFLAQLPYLFLYIVSIALAAMTDSNPSTAADKWYWFLPAVALVSVYGGWKAHAGANMADRWGYLARQALHWGAMGVVVHFLFRPDMQHFLNAETEGFVVMYILGLTSILAGIHSDWKMGLFGLFVILTAVVIGWVDDNALMLGLISAAAAMGIVAMFVVRTKVGTRAKNPSEA